jgi:hypothetical protein
MTGKSNEKITEQPIANERRRAPFLRLVNSQDRVPSLMERAAIARHGQIGQTTQSLKPHWDGNDDDPGPSAA